MSGSRSRGWSAPRPWRLTAPLRTRGHVVGRADAIRTVGTRATPAADKDHHRRATVRREAGLRGQRRASAVTTAASATTGSGARAEASAPPAAATPRSGRRARSRRPRARSGSARRRAPRAAPGRSARSRPARRRADRARRAAPAPRRGSSRVATARTPDRQPDLAHQSDRQEADQGRAEAAITGTPAGVNGISTRATRLPSPATRAGSPGRSSPSTSRQRKKAGKSASSPRAPRVADQVAGEDADRGPSDPARVGRRRRAHHERGVEAPAAAAGRRPGEVDHRLADRGAAQGPPRSEGASAIPIGT